ncbi:MAG: hypothetical protein WC675_05610 [Patescibacteria group bacterium]|jgi:hypothetical protein
MIYFEGLMHRKINIFIAILVIAIVAGLAAWAITAQSFGGKDAGLLILGSQPLKCTLDEEDAVTCYNTCPICGDIIGCATLWEVQAKKLSGVPGTLHKNTALCLLFPFPTRGGQFKSGARCLGKVLTMPTGSHLLFNFGCSTR